MRDSNKVATFSGNVHLVQGDTMLRCKVLVVFYDQDDSGAPAVKSATPGPTGSSQIRRMEAKGAVVVTQKDQTATGDSAIYDLKDNTVTLLAPAGGRVTVTQGPNVMSGPNACGQPDHERVAFRRGRQRPDHAHQARRQSGRPQGI